MQKLLISFVLFWVCLCLLWVFLDQKAPFIRISMESSLQCRRLGLQNPIHLKLVSCHFPWFAGADKVPVVSQTNRNSGRRDPLEAQTALLFPLLYWILFVVMKFVPFGFRNGTIKEKSASLNKPQPWMWQFIFCLFVICLCLKSISLDTVHFWSLWPDQAHSE